MTPRVVVTVLLLFLLCPQESTAAGGVARFQTTGATGSGCGLANIIGVAAPPKGRGPPTPPAFPGLRKK